MYVYMQHLDVHFINLYYNIYFKITIHGPIPNWSMLCVYVIERHRFTFGYIHANSKFISKYESKRYPRYSGN